MFDQFGLSGNILILLAGLVSVYFASRKTVEYSVKTADASGVSKTAIGFTLIAFITSLPELLVSIFSVLEPGAVGITIGNVLGANITNLTLVLGTCYLMITFFNKKTADISSSMSESDLKNFNFSILFASIIPILILYSHDMSRYIGIFLLGTFIIYMWRLLKKQTGSEYLEDSIGNRTNSFKQYLIIALVSAMGLVLGAFFIVESASYVATQMGVPRLIIGATIVSIGTTLPEFSTSIVAFRRGQYGLAIGNLVGSSMINLSCIMGFALTATAFQVNFNAFLNLVLLSIVANLIVSYIFTLESFAKWHGFVFLSIYLLFIFVLYLNPSI